jgi:hypothetical protein
MPEVISKSPMNYKNIEIELRPTTILSQFILDSSDRVYAYHQIKMGKKLVFNPKDPEQGPLFEFRDENKNLIEDIIVDFWVGKFRTDGNKIKANRIGIFNGYDMEAHKKTSPEHKLLGHGACIGKVPMCNMPMWGVNPWWPPYVAESGEVIAVYIRASKEQMVSVYDSIVKIKVGEVM